MGLPGSRRTGEKRGIGSGLLGNGQGPSPRAQTLKVRMTSKQLETQSNEMSFILEEVFDFKFPIYVHMGYKYRIKSQTFNRE